MRYPPVVSNGGGVRTVNSVVRLAAAACIFTLVGCGSPAAPKAIPRVSRPPSLASVVPSAPAPVTSAPSNTATLPSPTASPSRFREAYVNAFQDFWVAYAHADEEGAPTSSLLSDRATGAALAWARKQISDHVKLGVAHRGVAHFREVGAEHVTARSALVGECQDWSAWPVVNRKTGVPFQQFDSYSQLVSAQMVLANGQWKLATVRVQAAAC